MLLLFLSVLIVIVLFSSLLTDVVLSAGGTLFQVVAIDLPSYFVETVACRTILWIVEIDVSLVVETGWYNLPMHK